MGTNFYLKDAALEDNHIGKRSAAGRYCWDCGRTLCKQGNQGIHYSESEWYNACPVCGKKPVNESLDESSAGIELGFNKNGLKKTGVSSCCSFTWANDMDQNLFLNTINLHSKIVRDEYGRSYTAKEFLEILTDCPIQYRLKREFS